MISVELGLIGAVVTFFLLETFAVKVCVLAAFFALTVALVVATRRQQARDQSDLKSSYDAVSRRNANAERALHTQAILLADEIDEFLVERRSSEPAVPSFLAGTDRHAEYAVAVDLLNRWHADNGRVYQRRFSRRVRSLAGDMARMGVADDELLTEANRQTPPSTDTMAAVPRLLRSAAGRLSGFASLVRA